MMHRLTHDRANLHANFVRGATPALVIESGDTVALSAPDVSWGLEPPTSTTAPRRKVEPRDPMGNPARDSGPCLTGPIAVRGAVPGDVLEIEIEQVTPSEWGWTYAGKGMASEAWNTAVGISDAPLTLMKWTIDRARNEARAECGGGGLVVPARAFPGTIGLAPLVPAEKEYASGWLPTVSGGNMDCRELVAGSTLMLPVMVDGGMLSVGDGHAAQGDGELSGTAIECMLEEVRLRITRRAGRALSTPRVLSAPDDEGRRHRITIGIGATLDIAAAMATRGMLDWMEEELKQPRPACLTLASACVSLRVTQTVNALKGVHACWM